jgi:hypothetical protein
MESGRTYRDKVIAMLIDAFGEPEVSSVQSGNIYRWTLHRGPYGISMFITIDSPEYEDIAHVMISDAAHHQVEPVVSVTTTTIEEAKALIGRIVGQWKGSDHRASR